MSGFSELDAMIAKVRSLEGAPEAIAKIAAPLVQAAAKSTAAAGTTPSGEKWAPRKGGGAPVLSNAAAAVEAVAIPGPKVRLRLVGTSTGSQKVQAIQNHTRPIIPKYGDELAGPIAGAMTEACKRYFRRSMGK